MASMFSRVAFYPTLAYNVMMEKISSRRWFDRIDETVILGALPFRNIIDKLIKEENVKGVVSMNENFELNYWVHNREEYKCQGVQFLQLNTADIFHVPSQEKLRQGVAFIQQFESAGNSVYVHCKAGRTRSATLVGCYLMKKHRWEPNKAVEYMVSKRQHVLLLRMHWNALRTFYSQNVDTSQNKSINPIPKP